MARLRRDPEDDSDAVNVPTRRRHPLPPNTATKPLRRRPLDSDSGHSDTEGSHAATRPVLKSRIAPKPTTTQIRLASIRGKGVLGDLDTELPPTIRRRANKRIPNNASFNLMPAQSTATTIDTQEKGEGAEKQSTEEVDVEESIWCGSIAASESSSEDELPSVTKFLHARRLPTANATPPKQQHDLTLQLKALSIFDDDLETRTARPGKTILDRPRDVRPPASSSDKENDAVLRYSPPRLKSPRKQDPFDRPKTPPQLLSPAKSKLKSPSKRVPRIPTPPLRPSLDAFWTADAVNDWNDQYSPQKTLKSPRKLFFRPEPEAVSPSTSPGKTGSPFKRTKAELEAKKDFEARKVAMAESFLQELDQKITKGQVQQLAQSSGGVKLVWSKTLNTTAGRANWRKETTRARHANGETTSTFKHYASIELATKVIDDEHRLLNVIAHEFCHLANFMISDIKDQPHGRQFKEWGRMCTRLFGDRGVEVTTKHSYEIEYKYIWQCTSEDCAMQFKRHSKSIDPGRHRCGGCKSGLVQVKPVPRKKGSITQAGGGGSTSETPTGLGEIPATGYAAYVKEHFALLKKCMPGASHKEVMEALGKKYRADKAARTKTCVDSLTIGLGKVTLAGDGGCGGGGDDENPLIIDSD